MHELTVLCKGKSQMANQLHRWRDLPDYPSHQAHRDILKEYVSAIKLTRREHWEEWLFNALERYVWAVNKYVTDPAMDGGKACIPTLKCARQDGTTSLITSNMEKGAALIKAFFPPSPLSPIISHSCYLELTDVCQGHSSLCEFASRAVSTLGYRRLTYPQNLSELPFLPNKSQALVAKQRGD